MGKGTDKLYITHSEWSSADAYSASSGANTRSSANVPFRRLPFNFCAASLQPFKNPVCTPDGTIFDVEVIGAWLEKYPSQNPVNGERLNKKDLIRLVFSRNSDSDSLSAGLSDGKGDLVDPVTYKVFTDNTHIVAIRHGTYANVFAWETVERMNIKAKLWQDLVDDQPFTRADVITLQDPQNAASRNLDAFKFLKDGHDAQLTKDQEEKRRAGDINAGALGSMGDKVIKARAAVEKARKAREAGGDVNRASSALARSTTQTLTKNQPVNRMTVTGSSSFSTVSAPNAATYTTGRAAASFTSTGLTPETSAERALLTDEEYMLKPKRVKIKGYARIETNFGDLTIELNPEFAPKACWNFIKLAQKGYYRGVKFHRNIPRFMIQGGDPTGTGKGGQSIWGKNFVDELEGPLTHDARGIVSMANKGKDTNSSQFFITYKPTPHLDRKHTIFGLLTSTSHQVLAKMEASPIDSTNRPLSDITISDVVVFLDPFEEFLRNSKAAADEKLRKTQTAKTEDDTTTWTGKRLRSGATPEDTSRETSKVGKYLSSGGGLVSFAPAVNNDADTWEEPAKKKFKNGGFGNFDNW